MDSSRVAKESLTWGRGAGGDVISKGRDYVGDVMSKRHDAGGDAVSKVVMQEGWGDEEEV